MRIIAWTLTTLRTCSSYILKYGFSTISSRRTLKDFGYLERKLSVWCFQNTFVCNTIHPSSLRRRSSKRQLSALYPPSHQNQTPKTDIYRKKGYKREKRKIMNPLYLLIPQKKMRFVNPRWRIPLVSITLNARSSSTREVLSNPGEVEVGPALRRKQRMYYGDPLARFCIICINDWRVFIAIVCIWRVWENWPWDKVLKTCTENRYENFWDFDRRVAMLTLFLSVFGGTCREGTGLGAGSLATWPVFVILLLKMLASLGLVEWRMK